MTSLISQQEDEFWTQIVKRQKIEMGVMDNPDKHSVQVFQKPNKSIGYVRKGHMITNDLDMLCRYVNNDDDLPPDILRDVVEEISDLRAEVSKLIEALEFYAHGRNWAGWEYADETNDCIMWARPIEDDLGKTAREALGWETPEPPEAE